MLNNRKALFAYSLFDFANSAFTLIFHAYLFPLYLVQFVCKPGANSDLTWGILLSTSALIGMLGGPLAGRWADHSGRWKVFSIVALFSFVSALALSLTIGRQAWLVMSVFIAASALYYLAANLYDSLLNSLVVGNEKASFSGFAWGFGYVGGILCFVGVFFFQKNWGLQSAIPYFFAALFYAGFGILSLALLRRPLKAAQGIPHLSLRKIISAMTKERVGLLLGYFLIADTISAVISFTSLYASQELKLSATMIGGFLLGVQLLAFPFTYVMCRIATRKGVMKVLSSCVCIWITILILFSARVNFAGLIIIMALTALVIGTTQALMRVHYSELLEKGRDSEFFGWYGVATESSAIFAPLLFGIASFSLDSKRLAMALLILPLCAGFILVTKYSRKLSAGVQR